MGMTISKLFFKIPDEFISRLDYKETIRKKVAFRKLKDRKALCKDLFEYVDAQHRKALPDGPHLVGYDEDVTRFGIEIMKAINYYVRDWRPDSPDGDFYPTDRFLVLEVINDQPVFANTLSDTIKADITANPEYYCVMEVYPD